MNAPSRVHDEKEEDEEQGVFPKLTPESDDSLDSAETCFRPPDSPPRMDDGHEDKREPHNGWSEEVMVVLEKIRINSVNLSEYHRRRFFHFKGFSKYFDLPVLILSSLSASFSVGMQAYLEQHIISAVSCFIALLVSIITSIKLYLNISDSMQSELKMSRAFYTLAAEIYKTTSLLAHDRGANGLEFLNSKFTTYTKLMESSNLLKRKFRMDKLLPLDDRDCMPDSDESSNGSPSLPAHSPRKTLSVQILEEYKQRLG